MSRITNGQDISNDDQIIEYYSFEKVKKITEGTGATQKTAEFKYNADHQRISMVLKTNGTTTKTRYYFGSSCERELISTVYTQYIWIGGDAYTAVAVAKKVGTGNWTVYNIFRDHLGTITHLKTGSTVTEYSYEAWGRRRDKDDWTYTLTNEPALFADRGFTAHEYLEDFKLYNMNGRLYDPVVGRFLSPDPYIQDPGFTQSLNRYSYCLNNPLKFNDPSGEIWNLLFAWGGNWLIGGMDRWINQHQSFKTAFSPVKNPVVFSANFSPSNTTRQNNYGFSHPQIDAQKAANHEELVTQQLDDFVTSQSRAGYMNNLFKNLDVDLQGDWKLTFGVQAGGNIESIGGKYGLYANLCSITLLGNDGGKMVYPGSRLFGYSQINQGLSGGFIIGAGVSHTFDGSFEGGGSVNDNIAVHGLFTNKAGWGGTSYQYDTSTGRRTINIGLNPQIGLLLGFEGAFNLKISW